MEFWLRLVHFLNQICGFGLTFGLLWIFISVFVQKARLPLGWFLASLSYLLGFSTWLSAAISIYAVWGWIGFVVGFLIGGIGVVPLAIFYFLFHAEWAFFFSLLLAVALVFATRIGGLALAEREETRQRREKESRALKNNSRIELEARVRSLGTKLSKNEKVSSKANLQDLFGNEIDD